uniref:DUF6533 domain-containing protein n=1 Tax=Moniliophthora roreri TaxID=221103 RepID=A0A0W0FQN0_MONRR
MLSLCQLDAPFRPASRLFSHGKHFVDLTEDDVREHHVHSIAQVFAISTLLWDYLITLDKEIDSIWMRPKSRGVITFLAFRYLTLTTNISAFIFSFYPLEPEVSCSFNALFVILDPSVFRCRRRGVEVLASTVKFFSSFHSAQFAASLVFCNPPSLLIRPYSIIDLSHLRSILLRPENSMVIWNSHRVCGGILWQQFVLSRQDKVRYPILAECHVGISYETAIRIAGLWLTLFVYDTVIFSLTAARTYQFWRKVHLQHLHPSLLSLFFRDGAVYFGVMALVNLANILTFYNGYSNQTSYIAAFGRGHDDTLMSGKKAWAINYSANYSYFQAHQDQLEFSKWVNIFDNGRTCSKSSKNLRETLIEVVEEFAHYDLGSRSGMESAAWDLESRICAVSSGFKEAKEITGSKVGLA